MHREFGGAKLGDPRLQARLLDLGAAFFAQPQANIPQACGSPAAAKAAYRFFDNQRVTMDSLLEPHRQATASRMRREALVLVAQDTTSLAYTGRPEMQGIGPIANRLNGPQGRCCTARWPSRPRACRSASSTSSAGRAIRRFPGSPVRQAHAVQRQTHRGEGEQQVAARAGPDRPDGGKCPNTRVVMLSDRESDIYEYMLAAQQQGRDVVLRAKRSSAG